MPDDTWKMSDEDEERLWRAVPIGQTEGIHLYVEEAVRLGIVVPAAASSPQRDLNPLIDELRARIADYEAMDRSTENLMSYSNGATIALKGFLASLIAAGAARIPDREAPSDDVIRGIVADYSQRVYGGFNHQPNERAVAAMRAALAVLGYAESQPDPGVCNHVYPTADLCGKPREHTLHQGMMHDHDFVGYTESGETK